MDTAQPRNKTELLARIDSSRSALEGLIDGLTEEQMISPGPDGWSVKDHLAHILAWEQSTLDLIDGRPRYERMGLDRDTYESDDVDTINDAIYRRHKDEPLDVVLKEFHNAHQELMDRLAGMTDADLFEFAPYANDPEEPLDTPLVAWVSGNTYEHYDEHLGYIRQSQS